jgi:acyl-CoA thioesterase FadM
MSTGIGRVARLADGTTGCKMRLMEDFEIGSRYLNACMIGDELEISSWVDEWEGKTFVVKHQVKHDDGRVALEGFERRVWVVADEASPNRIRAIEIPKVAIERFADP